MIRKRKEVSLNYIPVLIYWFCIIFVILHHFSLEKWFLGKKSCDLSATIKKNAGQCFSKESEPTCKNSADLEEKKNLIYLFHMQNECRIRS